LMKFRTAVYANQFYRAYHGKLYVTGKVFNHEERLGNILIARDM
jgi:hypothetical protein